MTTIMRTLTIESLFCGVCNVMFGLESGFHAKRRQDGQIFCCPNGHKISYIDNENKNLKEERQRLEREVERERNWRWQAEERTAAERRSKAAIKGQLTKAKKRAHHAVCPYCPRTFANVQRHIDNMHPEHSAADHTEHHQ